MTDIHEEECYMSEGKFDGGCICSRLRHAFNRGFEDGLAEDEEKAKWNYTYYCNHDWEHPKGEKAMTCAKCGKMSMDGEQG